MIRCQILVSCAVLFSGSVLFAAKPAPNPVDMFAAIEAGDLEVKLIPKDSTRTTVIFKNVSDKKLDLRLPNAFAGIPATALAQKKGQPQAAVRVPDGILAQIGGAGGGLGAGGGGGGNQGFGGGMGGGMMGGGMGGGFFTVQPDAIRKVRIPICLLYTSPSPRDATLSRMPSSA